MTATMTFDELSELYRKEVSSPALTPARADLYRAMADLRARLREEYERQKAVDPDSVTTDEAGHRFKSAVRLCKEVTRIRAMGVCNMAFTGALGSMNRTDALTPEENEYHRRVRSLSEWMRGLGSDDGWRAPMPGTAQGEDGAVRELDLDETEMEIIMGSPECRGMTARDAVNRALYVYNLMGELMSYYPRQERAVKAPSESRAPAGADAPQEPRYDPGRPTEDDVGKVRDAMRQIWSTVKYLADRTGLEQYVVRRACKELVKGGEAAWKETNGTLQFMRTPRTVQARLPEPREARTMYAPRIREYLDDGAWRATPQIVRALGLEGDKGGWRKAYDALCRLALDGDLERYPPTIPGRHARASQVEWRLKPREGSE